MGEKPWQPVELLMLEELSALRKTDGVRLQLCVSLLFVKLVLCCWEFFTILIVLSYTNGLVLKSCKLVGFPENCACKGRNGERSQPYLNCRKYDNGHQEEFWLVIGFLMARACIWNSIKGVFSWKEPNQSQLPPNDLASQGDFRMEWFSTYSFQKCQHLLHQSLSWN